jgi:xylan 1,4-beta-xylosidase
MGRPNQLTKEQVKKMKKLNDGSPIYYEKIEVEPGESFMKELDIRENDVFLITITKL